MGYAVFIKMDVRMAVVAAGFGMNVRMTLLTCSAEETADLVLFLLHISGPT